MDSLQQTALWDVGAQITALFDWTAVGSVLLILTLLQAVWLGSTGSRRFEAQQIVVLRYIRAQLMKLRTVEMISAGALKDGVPIHKLSGLPLIEELENSFDNIDPMGLPTPYSMEAVEQSKSAIATLKSLYDPQEDDRELFIAMLPFTTAYTEYAIKIVEREIEDRDPLLLRRWAKKLRRGRAPSQPDSFLGQAMKKAKDAVD